MIYVIAYDISKDELRTRVYKYLSDWGRRIQKSVFECDLQRDELQKVVAHLQKLIVSSTDRCHIYRLCADCFPQRTVIGSDLEPAWGQTVVV